MGTVARIRQCAIVTLLLGGCGDDSAGGSTSLSGGTIDDGSASGGTTGAPTTDDPTTSGGTASSVPTTQPEDPTTGAPACTDDAQCGQGVGACQTGVCEAGVCTIVDLPADTLIPDEAGNCQKMACDGQGTLKQVADDDDKPADDPGNCKVAVCTGGAPEFVADDTDLPDDGIECTTDTCDQGTPKFIAKPVNSFCGEMGAKFCHEDTSCQDCKQVSEACEDDSMTEANETQAGAHSLGTITDADSSGGFVCAVLDGGDDVDWYTYNGNDVFLNFVDPTREVISDLNHRICVYITCDNGDPSIQCGGDETDDVAPLGQPGCCGMGNVSPSLNCAGTDDSATVWVKVENPDKLACVPYELKYHF